MKYVTHYNKKFTDNAVTDVSLQEYLSNALRLCEAEHAYDNTLE